MAKRKSKTNSAVMSVPKSSGSGSPNWDVSIRSADNGAVINMSHSSGGNNPKYTSKTLVATSPRAAFRIAAAHCPAMGKKSNGKRKAGKSKAFASKKA